MKENPIHGLHPDLYNCLL